MTDGFMSTPFSKAYVEKCNTQIAEIVDVVRGNLPAGARMTIGALIVIDVHGNVARNCYTVKKNVTCHPSESISVLSQLEMWLHSCQMRASAH